MPEGWGDNCETFFGGKELVQCFYDAVSKEKFNEKPDLSIYHKVNFNSKEVMTFLQNDDQARNLINKYSQDAHDYAKAEADVFAKKMSEELKDKIHHITTEMKQTFKKDILDKIYNCKSDSNFENILRKAIFTCEEIVKTLKEIKQQKEKLRDIAKNNYISLKAFLSKSASAYYADDDINLTNEEEKLICDILISELTNEEKNFFKAGLSVSQIPKSLMKKVTSFAVNINNNLKPLILELESLETQIICLNEVTSLLEKDLTKKNQEMKEDSQTPVTVPTPVKPEENQPCMLSKPNSEETKNKNSESPNTEDPLPGDNESPESFWDRMKKLKLADLLQLFYSVAGYLKKNKEKVLLVCMAFTFGASLAAGGFALVAPSVALVVCKALIGTVALSLPSLKIAGGIATAIGAAGIFGLLVGAKVVEVNDKSLFYVALSGAGTGLGVGGVAATVAIGVVAGPAMVMAAPVVAAGLGFTALGVGIKKLFFDDSEKKD